LCPLAIRSLKIDLKGSQNNYRKNPTQQRPH
jgi:hypothetical protein